MKNLINLLKGKYITILGHDNIDVDSCASGILLSRLLTYLGIENEFIILDSTINAETYQIMKKFFSIDMSIYFNSTEKEDRTLFLVDHFVTCHQGEVIACIDHHPTKQEISYPFYLSKRSCSTTFLIYQYMLKANYPISLEDAELIVASMMIDTTSFRSSKTVQEEVKEAKHICLQFGLNYSKLEQDCLCLTDTNQPIEQLIYNGYKDYCYNGYFIKSSYLQIYGEVSQNFIDECLLNIQQQIKDTNLSLWVFILFEFKNNFTYEYHITKTSFTLFTTHQIRSRGTDIMPKIEQEFANKNKRT